MLELNPNLIPSDLKQFFRPKRKYGMWIRRNSIVWHKESVMPESVKDRFTIDFEYIYMFSRQQKYFFERQLEPLQDVSIERYKHSFSPSSDSPNGQQWGNLERMGDRMNPLGRNKRTTWTINPQGYKGEHYATYPEELCRTPIEASCPEFVCTKCGKARIKVYQKTGELIKYGGYGSKTAVEQGVSPTSSLLTKCVQEQEIIGLSDCGCNAPFESGIILDPFSGVATTGVVAKKLGRRYIGIEISEKYHKLAIKRIQNTPARLI